jgi:hypothetical protein
LLEYDTVNLKKGKFTVATSEIVNPIYYSGGLDTFVPISGRPLMIEQLYDAYKAAGVIPGLQRSASDYSIGFVTYVIVSPKGGPDPNPIPVIISQPESQRVLAGGSAFFFIDAQPDGYLSYQWMFKGKPIPGERSFALNVANVTPARAGIYTVAMNTGGKDVLSQKALLIIAQPVAIKTQPKSQTVMAGKAATFRVAVTGTGPFAYRWYYGTSPITNAVKSFYTIPKVKAEDAGSYHVNVSNGASIAASTNAVLTVSP